MQRPQGPWIGREEQKQGKNVHEVRDYFFRARDEVGLTPMKGESSGVEGDINYGADH